VGNNHAVHGDVQHELNVVWQRRQVRRLTVVVPCAVVGAERDGDSADRNRLAILLDEVVLHLVARGSPSSVQLDVIWCYLPIALQFFQHVPGGVVGRVQRKVGELKSVHRARVDATRVVLAEHRLGDGFDEPAGTNAPRANLIDNVLVGNVIAVVQHAFDQVVDDDPTAPYADALDFTFDCSDARFSLCARWRFVALERAQVCSCSAQFLDQPVSRETLVVQLLVGSRQRGQALFQLGRFGLGCVADLPLTKLAAEFLDRERVVLCHHFSVAHHVNAVQAGLVRWFREPLQTKHVLDVEFENRFDEAVLAAVANPGHDTFDGDVLVLRQLFGKSVRVGIVMTKQAFERLRQLQQQVFCCFVLSGWRIELDVVRTLEVCLGDIAPGVTCRDAQNIASVLHGQRSCRHYGTLRWSHFRLSVVETEDFLQVILRTKQ